MSKFTVITVSAACWMCVPWASGRDANLIAPVLMKVRNEIRPLRFTSAPVASASEAAYFRYYGLDTKCDEHLFGSFRVHEKVLAAHVFRMTDARGTVILVHGYYDHAGVLRHIISDLVDRGYTVAVYDQPGHGLSSGERAAIGDFSEYVEVFEAFLELCRSKLPAPSHVVAHSMGCAVVMDSLLQSPGTTIGRTVFLAPLIRSAMWKLSRLGHNMGGRFVHDVPRKFRNNTSDKVFREFVKGDPLQPRRLPTSWVHALGVWNSRLAGRPPSARTLKVVQGDRDTTVDRNYNLRVLPTLFPRVEITAIKGAGHQLMNELEPMRGRVLALIAGYLE